MNKSTKLEGKKAKEQPTISKENNLSIAEKMHQRITQKKLTPADKRNQQLRLLFQQYKQLTAAKLPMLWKSAS